MKFHAMIATAGRSSLLERTLEGLAACEKPAGFAGLVLVENGGEPEAEALTDRYAESLGARHLFEPVGNKNRALNRGLASIDGGLVMLFDDDVRIDPGTLTAYAEAAARWPEAPFFGGWCGCDYVEPPADYLVAYLPASARGWSKPEDGQTIEDAGAMGFNWAIRAERVQELGGFDEDRGPGTSVCVGDETAMQRRLSDAFGPGRYVEAARVWHHVPPERCDEPWVVRRSYHVGIARAMARLDTGQSPMTPLASALKCWSTAWRYRLTQLCGDRAARFKALYYRELHRGIAAGHRLADAASSNGDAVSPARNGR